MLIVSILAFFVVIFLLASITVTVAWMGFLKTTAEQTDAARRDLEVDAPDAGHAHTARLAVVIVAADDALASARRTSKTAGGSA